MTVLPFLRYPLLLSPNAFSRHLTITMVNFIVLAKSLATIKTAGVLPIVVSSLNSKHEVIAQYAVWALNNLVLQGLHFPFLIPLELMCIVKLLKGLKMLYGIGWEVHWFRIRFRTSRSDLSWNYNN
jgi:hypothetical protein